MLATLSEAKDSALAEIAGTCTNSDKFLSLVNEGVRRLMNRGDFSGTLVPIQVCAYRGCVVFPRYVGSVREMRLNSRRVAIKNNWYQFMDARQWDWSTYCNSLGYHLPAAVIGSTQTPVFQDVEGDGRYIRAYPRIASDAGKSMTVFGVDNNGQPIEDTFPLASPYGQSSKAIRKIDRVIREETSGIVDVFAYNVDDDVLEPVAHYDPSDTNPSFTSYRIQAGGGLMSCMAFVKLRFIPVKNNTDLVLIQNLDALKDMIQSIKFKENGDMQNASLFEQSAIHELNLELRNNNPDDQISVEIRGFGTATPSRHRIGRIN